MKGNKKMNNEKILECFMDYYKKDFDNENDENEYFWDMISVILDEYIKSI